MAEDDRDTPSVSRRAFLKGGAMATGALSSSLVPLPCRSSDSGSHCSSNAADHGGARESMGRRTASTSPTARRCSSCCATTEADRDEDGLRPHAVRRVHRHRQRSQHYACTQLAGRRRAPRCSPSRGWRRTSRFIPSSRRLSSTAASSAASAPRGKSCRRRRCSIACRTRLKIRHAQALAGNLCRCAAYKKILESVMAASRLMQA